MAVGQQYTITARVARFGSSLLRQTTAYPLPCYRFLLHGVPAIPQARTPAIDVACRNELPWRELWRTAPGKVSNTMMLIASGRFFYKHEVGVNQVRHAC